MSKRAMTVMNNFVEDVFERICTEAAEICKYNHTSTLGVREVETAVRLVLPGGLAEFAWVGGMQAVVKYNEKTHAERIS